jgi:uncharacterized protein (TIGR02145 family)
MKTFVPYGLLILLVTSLTGCKEEETEPVNHPEITINLDGKRQTVPVEIAIPGKNWTAYSPTVDLWCTVSEGEGEPSLLVTVDANTTGEERHSHVMIISSHHVQKIAVSQDMSRYISLPPNLTLRGIAGSKTVTVEGNVPEPYTVTVREEDAAWLSASVTGGVITVSATRNPSTTLERAGIVEVSGIYPATREVVTTSLTVYQKMFGGVDYYFEIPDFSLSNVYKVMDGSKQIAQVCKEFLNKSSLVSIQAIVVYPVNGDGVVNLNAGYVARVLLAQDGTTYTVPTTNIHGGKVVFDESSNTITGYSAGNAPPVTTVYMPGDDEMGSSAVEGSLLASTTPDLITDTRESETNTYSIVKIGTQYWMGQNLNTTRYNSNKNHAAITTNITNTNWSQMDAAKNYTPACAVYGYPDANDPLALPQREKSGVLYTFLAINGASSIAGVTFDAGMNMTEDNLSPDGWMVPTRDELTALLAYIGGTSAAYLARLREFLDSEGNMNNISGQADENITGFSARNGSYRSHSGGFTALGSSNGAFFWCRSKSTETADRGWGLNLSLLAEQQYMRAFSIRCLKK